MCYITWTYIFKAIREEDSYSVFLLAPHVNSRENYKQIELNIASRLRK
jgi:hypothetical protein